MKKLFIKELLENRWLPVGLGLLVILLMVALKMLNLITVFQSPLLLMASWSLAAIFAASSLFSREVGNNTLQFLMALPVSRAKVWSVKALAGFTLMILSIGSTVVAWAAAHFVLFGYGQFSFNGSVGLDNRGWILFLWVLLVAIACYALSLTISTLLDRALSAAMVSVLALAALAMPIGLVCSVYMFLPGANDNPTDSMCLVATSLAPALLLASYWAFTRGESLRTPRRFKQAALGCVVGFAIVWTPLLLGTTAMSQFHRTGNQQTNVVLSPDGKSVAVEVLNGGPRRTVSNNAPISPQDQIHSAELFDPNDPGSYRAQHLVLEWTGSGAKSAPWILPGSSPMGWSPDGRFLVYAQTVGPFGLGLERSHMLVADIKTGIIHTFPWLGTFNDPNFDPGVTWSPDGQWLSIRYGYRSEAQFVARAALERPEEMIDHRVVASTQVDTSPPETNDERSSRTFHLVHTGSALQGTHVWDESRGGWSPDSRFSYTVDSGVLVAIEPQKDMPSWGKSRNEGNDSGGQKEGTYPLCTLPPYTRLLIETSANPHRALVTLIIADPQGNGSAEQHFQSGANESHWIIDLQAATVDAAHQDRDRSLPEVQDWLRRWSSHPLPRGSAQGSISISPDGQFLAVRRPNLDWKAVRSQSPAAAGALAIPPGGETPDTLLLAIDSDAVQVVPRRAGTNTRGEWWLPNGHRYCTEDSSGILRISDAVSGKNHAYLLGRSQLVGLDSTGQLLIAPHRIDDPFQPIERVIPILSTLPGGH
ncbi:MAG: ABC transporter permease [Armatimonadota bacterium]|nr:ABC transporter permease [Armatimonadota bacterium]